MAQQSAAGKRLPIISAIALPALALLGLSWLSSDLDSLIVTVGLDPQGGRALVLGKLFSATLTLCGFMLVFRLTAAIVIDGLIQRSLQRPVPRILHDVLGLCFFIGALLAATHILFSQAFSGVLALSGILGIVIGLALRPIILDAFSGLSANLEAAFQIGDWVTINEGSISYTGWVDQINWRTTSIRTRDGNLIVCPNSTFGTSVVTNHSRPFPHSRYEILVKLPPEYPIEQGVELLLQAVNATLEQKGGPTHEKKPDVIVVRMSNSGVEYRVRFWLNPASESYDTAIHLVNASVQRHLQFAGVRLASDREEVAWGRARQQRAELDNIEDRIAVLSALPLLAGLNRTQLTALASDLKVRWFDEGENLVQERDDTTGMFILAEGLLRVTKEDQGKNVLLSQLHPGDYFGEMALLTGAKRTATVTSVIPSRVFEIERETIESVIRAEPEVMRSLSLNLARRQAATNQALEAASRAPMNPTESSAGYFMKKMRSLFSFTRSPFTND